MSDDRTIEQRLLQYLHEHHLVRGPIDCQTDLIQSGQLDSLVVMDVVGFVASNFRIEMSPHEISPDNLRSVERLARFVAAASRVSGEAA